MVATLRWLHPSQDPKPEQASVELLSLAQRLDVERDVIQAVRAATRATPDIRTPGEERLSEV